MDPKFMTEEDMMSCGLLPSAEPPSVMSSDEEEDEWSFNLNYIL